MATQEEIITSIDGTIRNKTAAGSVTRGAVANALTSVLKFTSAVTRAANPNLGFDTPLQRMTIVQDGPLSFTRANSGNLQDADARVVVYTDGSPVEFSSDFYVPDFVDTTGNLLLHFTNLTADNSLPALVLVTNLPKPVTAVTVGAPTNFQAALTSFGTISLAWSAGANATSYVVERSTTSDFTANFAQVYTGSNTSYTDTAVAASTAYYYRVKGRRAGSPDSGYATLAQPITSGSNPQNPQPAYYAFTDDSQSLTVANAQDFDFSLSGFSVAFWAGLGDVGSALSFGRSVDNAPNDGTNGRRWDVVVRNTSFSGKRVAVTFWDNANVGSYIYVESDVVPELNNNLARFVVTHDGVGSVKIYVNGRALNATVYPGPNGFASTRTGGTFRIGPVAKGSSYEYTVSTGAKLDVMAFANRVLTSAEVTEDFNGGVRNNMQGVSFYNALLSAWLFDHSLADSVSNHTLSAANPVYVNY